SISGAISDWLSSGSTARRLRSFMSCLRDWTIAASRRAPSAAVSAAWIFWRVISASGSVVPNTGPIATPSAMEIPVKRRSGRVCCPMARRARRLCCGGGGSILLIEAGFHQPDQGIERFLGVPALGAQLDDRAAPGTQHHQPHDRTGGHALPVPQHVNRGAELLGQHHETRGGPGVHAALVGDGNRATKYGRAGRRG